MITSSNFRDYLKTSGIAEHYYIGKLNGKEEKSIGVYQLKRYNDYMKAVGGEANDHIKKKAISLLVHWNKNSAETEEAANKLYTFLKRFNSMDENIVIGNHEVSCAIFIQNEPIDVSTDEFGIYERVIELELYYKE